MGDGARCEICVVWADNGSGHVFMAEQVDGETIFLDPQSNKVYDDSVFDKVTKSYTKYFRVYDIDFNDNILDCCLMSMPTKDFLILPVLNFRF